MVIVRSSGTITAWYISLNVSPEGIPREMLNKSAFDGEPASLRDAGINKINVLAPLILPQKFLHLFAQHFPSEADNQNKFQNLILA